MIELLLALACLLSFALIVEGEVCGGMQYFSNLTVVTAGSAPGIWNNLDEWCSQFGLTFAAVSYSEFTTLQQIGEDCSVDQNIAVSSVNGIQWGQCFLTQPDGFYFPSNPGVQCGTPRAVACRPAAVVTLTGVSTVTFLNRTTVTLRVPTVTLTESLTSSRLKTLPCGTFTVSLNLTQSLASTTTTTTVTESVFETILCPNRALHICPSRSPDMVLLSGSSFSRNANRRQALCACRQDNFQSMALVSGANIGAAASILFDCLGSGARAWIEYPVSTNRSALSMPCLMVDNQGAGFIDSCNIEDKLPVMCSTSCHPPHHDDTTEDSSSSASNSWPFSHDFEHHVFMDLQAQVCPSGNVTLVLSGLASNITNVCADLAMTPLDWIPEIHNANMFLAAQSCGYQDLGYVRSFNGTVAECQKVGFPSGPIPLDTLVMLSEGCSASLGVWCVSGAVNVPTSTTGTFTGSVTSTTITVASGTVRQSVSTIIQPTTTTTTLTVTTVRSLVLTPYTTTTTFQTTQTTTIATVTETTTKTTRVMTSTTTRSVW